MTEATFQTYFSKWLLYNWPYTVVYELKICKGTSFSFDSVEPHQEQNLWNAKHRSLRYKIPDDSRGQKPFDGFKIVGCPAYIVVLFYPARGQGEFVAVDIDAWRHERATCGRKSITCSRAKEIGMSYVLQRKVEGAFK